MQSSNISGATGFSPPTTSSEPIPTNSSEALNSTTQTFEIKQEESELPLSQGSSDLILVDQMPATAVPIASHHKINNFAPLWQTNSKEIKQEIDSAPVTKPQTFFPKNTFTKKEQLKIHADIKKYKTFSDIKRAKHLEDRMKERKCDGSIPGLRGMEVIAAKDMKRAELLGHFAGTLHKEPEETSTPSHASLVLDSYSLGIGDNKFISTFQSGNVTSRINAATTHKLGRKPKIKKSKTTTPVENVVIISHKIKENINLPFVVAKKDISEGQVLWLDYGAQYWHRMRKNQAIVSQQLEDTTEIISDDDEADHSTSIEVPSIPIIDLVSRELGVTDESRVETDSSVINVIDLDKDVSGKIVLNNPTITEVASSSKTAKLIKKTKGKLFKCSDCDNTFNRRNNLIEHQQQHRDKKYQVTANPNITSSPELIDIDALPSTSSGIHSASISTNESTSHSKKQYPCTFTDCKKSFDKQFLLTRHVKLHTDERTYQCEYCEKCYKSESSLKHHRISHINPTELQCNQCDKIFSRKSSLNSHMKIHTGTTPFQCQFCAKSFAYISKYKKHMLVHSDEQVYFCNTCVKGFKTQDAFNQHKKIHTDKRSFPCVLCPTIVKSSFQLKLHAFTHTINKPYGCSICGKKFIRFYALKCHKQVHKGELKFACNLCPAKYMHSYQLKKHSYRHKNATPYRCKTCNKSFTNLYNFKLHEKRHLEDRPFKCTLCPKGYISISELNQHQNYHKKPVKCGKCEQSFANFSQLKRHNFSHTGEKPFPCVECSKSFQTSCQLTKHKLTHSGEKPNACKFCDFSTANSSNLSRHIKRKHPDQT